MSWESEVAICNGALSLLGAERIVSLDDASKEAILCNQFYEQCRDSVQRAYPWNFATHRARLSTPLASTDSNAPVWGWAYGFPLPTDPYCLRVVASQYNVPYKVEGRTLYTDETAINIRYIKRVSDPGVFDAQFKAALSANIAMMIAMPITKSRSILADMKAIYDDLLSQGYGVDAQEGTPDVIDSNELLEVRYGGHDPVFVSA